jgi:hypothetical protein
MKGLEDNRDDRMFIPGRLVVKTRPEAQVYEPHINRIASHCVESQTRADSVLATEQIPSTLQMLSLDTSSSAHERSRIPPPRHITTHLSSSTGLLTNPISANVCGPLCLLCFPAVCACACACVWVWVCAETTSGGGSSGTKESWRT